MVESAPFQSITLNLPYDLSEDMWDRIEAVYRSMPGWIGFDGVPYWFGHDDDPRNVWASVEPSGLLVEGQVENDIWTEWIATLCARLSSAVGFEIRDAEA